MFAFGGESNRDEGVVVVVEFNRRRETGRVRGTAAMKVGVGRPCCVLCVGGLGRHFVLCLAVFFCQGFQSSPSAVNAVEKSTVHTRNRVFFSQIEKTLSCEIDHSTVTHTRIYVAQSITGDLRRVNRTKYFLVKIGKYTYFSTVP